MEGGGRGVVNGVQKGEEIFFSGLKKIFLVQVILYKEILKSNI